MRARRSLIVVRLMPAFMYKVLPMSETLDGNDGKHYSRRLHGFIADVNIIVQCLYSEVRSLRFLVRCSSGVFLILWCSTCYWRLCDEEPTLVEFHRSKSASAIIPSFMPKPFHLQLSHMHDDLANRSVLLLSRMTAYPPRHRCELPIIFDGSEIVGPRGIEMRNRWLHRRYGKGSR
ncbi:hypothetical protein K431DRAFT_130747 [Polychaeton citri CBS 116435]|uniref:Uncharacterized protein n=1 Tax=Polychaeton citri CBS 116435 TaxID=1314669 RepID=A0A9P4QGV9_9PEZI|nr:hypothetical protein K431DRAFT_130747 [Polychaeton citri CBS 116435]